MPQPPDPLIHPTRLAGPRRYANIIRYSNFSLHMGKAEVPLIASRLRSLSLNKTAQLRLHQGIRQHKRGFIWWRPEGLAYEYTLAALGERVASLGLDTPDAAARAAWVPVKPPAAATVVEQ